VILVVQKRDFRFNSPITFHDMPLTRLLLFLTLPLYILDQITKAWTVANFSEPPPGEPDPENQASG
jgi:hypothetical protein